MRSRVLRGLTLGLLVSFLAVPAFADGGGRVEGTVVDGAGSPVAGAQVSLRNAQQVGFGAAESDAHGRFAVDGVPDGSFEIVVRRHGFDVGRASVDVSGGAAAAVRVELSVAPIDEAVTVSAESGQVTERDLVPQAVNVISADQIRTRVHSVLAEVANGEAGLALQSTSPTIGAIFVRGLTGKNVAVFVDGVRYTTSAQRGGISTFFNLNEPTSLGAVEVLRGPNSAQYGSDSLGGTVALVNRVPYFAGTEPAIEGQFSTFYDSPSNAFGGNLLLSYGTRELGVLANVAGRRVNTLRPADGLDGHAAVTRFLGLPSDALGEDRLPDTGFTQYAGTFHLNYAPTEKDQIVFHYQRGQQDGGKRYDQLLGGDGNLRADLRNLMLDFGYLRYHRQDLPLFDSGSFTLSYNTQREERVNQGGQGNPLGSITSQYEKTRVLGFQLQLAKELPRDNAFLLGGDVYRERIDAPAHSFSPATRSVTATRPRIPNGARYLAFGAFAQDTWEAVPRRLWLSAALRWNVASYESRASQSPIVNGKPLFPDDSLRVDDVSGRAGVVVAPVEHLYVAFNYSRGYRAPDVTDLGTLGLTGDGFEVAAPDIAGLGGTVGTTADDKAISSGRPVVQLRSETTDNYDLSVRVHTSRVDVETTGFIIDFDDPISKQALILPQGAVGTSLGGQPIVAQNRNGVVFVALSASPVLVRANYGPARLSGFETETEVRLARDWSFGGTFTYLRAEDRAAGAAPNIEGGTPPATANLRLRYEPVGARWWAEAYATLADRQNRLSSLDLSDRRTGAKRSRGSIAAFFANGARVRGLAGPGPDAAFGTADDVLLPTGETLSEVQSRLLGTAESAPLFAYIPGYGIVGLRGGFRVGERSDVFVDFSNLADKSYRGLSWGLDGPGRGVAVSYRYQF